MGFDTHNAHFHVRHTLQRLCTLSRRGGAFVFIFASTSATIHRPFSVCKGCAGLINIVHSGILCDHVPDFNIDFGFLIPYALFPKPCPSPAFITRRISQISSANFLSSAPLLLVHMVHELKTSNRYAKTGFLFCT